MTAITIQYEITIARRGRMTTDIREKTFVSEKHLNRWLALPQNQGNVTVLRYLANPDRPAGYEGVVYDRNGAPVSVCIPVDEA